MVWIFKKLSSEYSSPISAGFLKINSTVQRGFPKPVAIENILKWDDSIYYTANIKNSSFEIDFINSSHIFTKYRLKGVTNSCAPYKWTVEGSEDHVNYKTLHIVNRSLCHSYNIENDWYEEFLMTRISKVRYIKVVNTGG